MLSEWKASGLTAPEVCVKLANACIGWSYVFSGRGEHCTPSNRRTYINTNMEKHPDEAAEIRNNCQVASGKSSVCNGCKYYPDGTTLFYDCRGFTYWCLLKGAGIKLSGGGCTSQYNNNANWAEKGTIDKMPKDKVCCVFRYDKSTSLYEHTLLYDGNGHFIHCSGEVKKVDMSKYKATHYAIPKGLYSGGGDVPVVGEKATVYAEKGSTVNMRKSESIVSQIVMRIPIGATIEVTSRGNEWCAIRYNGKTGYMMTKYIKFGDTATYTCTIRGLTKEQADALAKQYKNCTVTQG